MSSYSRTWNWTWSDHNPQNSIEFIVYNGSEKNGYASYFLITSNLNSGGEYYLNAFKTQYKYIDYSNPHWSQKIWMFKYDFLPRGYFDIWGIYHESINVSYFL